MFMIVKSIPFCKATKIAFTVYSFHGV